ncbi:MAG: DUF6715 family protein [Acetivibrio sp.]
MKKTQKTAMITIGILFILTVLIIGGFYYITQKKQTSQEANPTTEAGKLIKKNIEDNYPGTPREVLKLYCRITECMYNDEIKDTELEKLAMQLRILFDDELLKKNPPNTFLNGLRTDIESYHENKQRISSYDVQLASETDYATIKKEKYATLKISILLQQTGKKSHFARTNEQFLLRKDNKGRWKIAHWQLAAAEDLK